jgi:hypothetical protein
LTEKPLDPTTYINQRLTTFDKELDKSIEQQSIIKTGNFLSPNIDIDNEMDIISSMVGRKESPKKKLSTSLHRGNEGLFRAQTFIRALQMK